jgi:hypothetical protein
LYAQYAADAACRPALDLVMSRNRRLGKGCGIHPDIVFAAVMVQDTAMLTQVL